MQGDGVVFTFARITTDEHVDGVVKLDHRHSISLGPRGKCRVSHVRVRGKPFTQIRLRPRAAPEFLIHRSQRRSIAH